MTAKRFDPGCGGTVEGMNQPPRRLLSPLEWNVTSSNGSPASAGDRTNGKPSGRVIRRITVLTAKAPAAPSALTAPAATRQEVVFALPGRTIASLRSEFTFDLVIRHSNRKM
jgi:hypothetical protein